MVVAQLLATIKQSSKTLAIPAHGKTDVRERISDVDKGFWDWGKMKHSNGAKRIF